MFGGFFEEENPSSFTKEYLELVCQTHKNWIVEDWKQVVVFFFFFLFVSLDETKTNRFFSQMVVIGYWLFFF